MAETKLIMPQMGESIFEGTLTRWLKKPGDRVERDEPLFEISTDKVDTEIPAPASGVLAEILVTEGATVSVNAIVARIAAANFTKQLGQTFFVENHGGANGIVGTDMVAKAAPDGYTLMVYSSGFVINQFVNRKLPYDTVNDFAHVTALITSPMMLLVHPSLPARSVKEFLTLARARA